MSFSFGLYTASGKPYWQILLTLSVYSNPLVTLVTNHSYYSHCVHVWFKKMYELMTMLNMSQSPLRWLGFLQNIGRLAVVIWETFLTRNRHVECKHRKPTPSYTPYVRIGFRMFDKILAGKDSMHRTYPKKSQYISNKTKYKVYI